MSRANESMLLATVLCGHCTAEGRRRPGVLGKVRRFHSGRVNWYAMDPRWKRLMRDVAPETDWKVRGAVTLSYPLHGVTAPDKINVFCRHHGPGCVASTDITDASGSISVTFKATT